MIRTIAFIAAMLAMSGIAGAQGFPADILNTPIDGSVASWIIRTFGLLTVLSVAPGILIMVTSFPRFVIAFAILRTGMGLATTPSNMIMVSLALFMTFYVMAPTFDRAWQNGVNPLLQNQINETEAMTRIAEPFREFMLANTRDKDLQLFIDIAQEKGQTVVVGDRVDLRAVVPAFMNFGDPARVRDRLFDHASVPGDRPDRRHHHHGDGHDDAAAHLNLAAFQDPVLRPHRRLEPPGRQPGTIVQLNRLAWLTFRLFLQRNASGQKFISP